MHWFIPIPTTDGKTVTGISLTLDMPGVVNCEVISHCV